MTTISWPRKQREIVDSHLDSTIWNEFEFRDDDIVIANWGKSGCTWLQQIVGALLFQDTENVRVADISPWVEFAYAPRASTLSLLSEQTHRRFFKTHLPVDALLYSPRAKYLYIARDGRDVAWSLFNHFRRLSDGWYRMMNLARGDFGALPAAQPRDFRSFFSRWLDDGYPFWPFWPSIHSWWQIRDLPNVLFLHFLQLHGDMAGTVERIAAFLGITVPESRWGAVLERCTHSYMAKNASRIIAGGDFVFADGAAAFFNGGQHAGWRGQLTEADLQRYSAAQSTQLSSACAQWLETGVLCN